MTLVIAVGCTDGVIIAADSAMTDTVIGTKQPTQKIRRIGSLPVLYGSSGNVGLIQQVEEQLEGFQAKLNVKRTRQELKRLVLPELDESRKSHVPYPQQGFAQPPVCILLVVGVLEAKPWILMIERDGSDELYGPSVGYFAAIGSGAPWAQAIMRPHLMTERNLEQGKVFAYRVMEDSIDLAAAGLAKPIHMYTISGDGTVLTVEPEEQDHSLAPTCELWRSLERDAVGRLFAPAEEASPVAIPEPAPSEAPEASAS